MVEPKQASPKIPFYNWLDEIAFPADKFPVSPLYLEPGVHLDEYLNTDKDTGCIMDDPARTMGHPIIDFDVEKASELVIRSAQSDVVGRGKPVFAIARGTGGGKSRIMEEIRRSLLSRDKCVPVAITFNGDSEIGRDTWWTDFEMKTKAYVLSLTARVASALFGVSYATTKKCLSLNLERLDLISPGANDQEMIYQMLKFFMGRVNDGRTSLGEGKGKGETVALADTFVLLLDENRKVDTFAKRNDVGCIVRFALMNRKLPGLKVSVVISDLGFLPEDLRSASDRKVVLFLIPVWQFKPRKGVGLVSYYP